MNIENSPSTPTKIYFELRDDPEMKIEFLDFWFLNDSSTWEDWVVHHRKVMGFPRGRSSLWAPLQSASSSPFIPTLHFEDNILRGFFLPETGSFPPDIILFSETVVEELKTPSIVDWETSAIELKFYDVMAGMVRDVLEEEIKETNGRARKWFVLNVIFRKYLSRKKCRTTPFDIFNSEDESLFETTFDFTQDCDNGAISLTLTPRTTGMRRIIHWLRHLIEADVIWFSLPETPYYLRHRF